LDQNIDHFGGGLLQKGIYRRSRPSALWPGNPQFIENAVIVDLHHDAVNFVRQILAVFVPILAEFKNIIQGFAIIC